MGVKELPTPMRWATVGALLATVLAAPRTWAAESVQVMHWWTSGSEAVAVEKFKSALAARGVEWKDAAVGGGDNERLLLKARVMKGDPPDAAQVTADVLTYASNPNNLVDLTAVATSGKWDAALPDMVRRYATMGGKSYVVVPVGINRQNVMWISADGLKKIGASAPPRTWNEFFAMADKAKAAGMQPLAVAEDTWVNFMFMQVAYSTMQPDAYRKAFEQLDAASLKGPGMVKAFEMLRKLRGYADRGASTRKWNEATQMVIRGKAFAQVMGDWAKGEFTVAGKKPNIDYFCTPLPGTENGYQFNADGFMLFRRGAQKQSQQTLAEVLMDKRTQTAFSLVKGSVPARVDSDVSQFDECSKQSYSYYLAASKQGTLTAAPQMTQTPARIAAWRDTVLSFWYDDTMAPQQAADRMAAVAKPN
ncbi:ABC transporter substrate-binding protein [Burkholderia gladioli]|uniref:ABC transporter substrate-binding protein n=1 Tax=Burkholderia gladioli TaxID=28095 RepID=UPI0009E31BFA|nr:ABC transporter substrate-binding protein [Burkholderia gladioli]MDA0570339.1 ABC transporter substrate-binding protein [Burkholderia gladioli]MDA0603317.1 ABC transporter substrate-binding protein [Burkholderia gladioli]